MEPSHLAELADRGSPRRSPSSRVSGASYGILRAAGATAPRLDAARLGTVARMALVRDMFPPDDPVSRFLISMAIASNDIELAMSHGKKASLARKPESNYWVRLVMGHLVEAVDALDRWRNDIARCASSWQRRFTRRDRRS
jgi:hypothetical protein